MIGRVGYTDVSQIAKQAACILAPAAVSVALRAVMRPKLSSEIRTDLFYGAVVFCPTMLACRWHEWAWTTTLVTSFVLACLAEVMSAFILPAPPSSNSHSPANTSLISSSTDELTNPTLVFGVGAQINGNQVLNFARVEKAGGLQFIPVVATRECTEVTHRDVFKHYDGTALGALLLMAQDRPNQDMQPPVQQQCDSCKYYESPITFYLENSQHFSIRQEALENALLEGKDDFDNPVICTFNHMSTLAALKLIKEKQLPTTFLHKTTIATQEILGDKTLFTLWAGRGHLAITKLILELNPAVIGQLKHQKSPVIKAAVGGHLEEAQLLIKALGETLLTEEWWIRTTLQGNCIFSKGDFDRLEKDERDLVFFVANLAGQQAVVDKLILCGMTPTPWVKPGCGLQFECRLAVLKS